MKLFTVNDPCFKCPCAKCQADQNSPGIEQELVDRLNAMQVIMSDHGEYIITPTSGRRCPEHNAAVGGKQYSWHLAGLASDLATEGDSELAYRLVDAAMVNNLMFIELCPKHVHVDMRYIDVQRLIIGEG